jgi:hypothetical protein
MRNHPAGAQKLDISAFAGWCWAGQGRLGDCAQGKAGGSQHNAEEGNQANDSRIDLEGIFEGLKQALHARHAQESNNTYDTQLLENPRGAEHGIGLRAYATSLASDAKS